jgi:hypothetical protein
MLDELIPNKLKIYELVSCMPLCMSTIQIWHTTLWISWIWFLKVCFRGLI